MTTKYFFVAAAFLLTVSFSTGCETTNEQEKGPAQKMGETLDETVKDVRTKLDEGAEHAKTVVEGVSKNIDGLTDELGHELRAAGDSLKQAGHRAAETADEIAARARTKAAHVAQTLAPATPTAIGKTTPMVH